MDKENSQIIDEYNAYILAKDMYDRFFNELMTAVVNSMENFKNTQVKTKHDEHDIDTLCGNWYYQGKADAFREIGERLLKEKKLAELDLVNSLKIREKMRECNNNEDYVKFAVKEKLRGDVYENIRRKKNEEAERILPDSDFRFRKIYDKVMRMRAGIADLLEHYAIEGFRLGREFEICKITLPNHTVSTLNDPDITYGFEPKKFADKCIETFIPEDYNNF